MSEREGLMVRLHARCIEFEYIVLKIRGRDKCCCYLDGSCHFAIHITHIPSMATLSSHSNISAKDILRPAREVKPFCIMFQHATTSLSNILPAISISTRPPSRLQDTRCMLLTREALLLCARARWRHSMTIRRPQFLRLISPDRLIARALAR